MVSLFVCGDIVNQSSTKPFVGESLSRVIRTADYSVCNFEGPELEEGQTANCISQKHGTAACLKEVGFDLMLLANNHITELGANGVQYSINTIKAAGADCLGAGLSWEDTYRPFIKEIKGVKFGFFNVCEAQVGQYLNPKQGCGYAWMGYDSFFDDIKSLAKVVDYVVVFVHAGLEHYHCPLPEIRDFYKRIIDAGASAVIGGHPHSAQGWEYYNDRVIVYSLGNFFFPIRDKWPLEAYSYSVNITFNHKEISLTPIPHYNNGICVDVDNSNAIDFEYLNNLLCDSYDGEIDWIIKDAYKNQVKTLLVDALCGQNERDGIKSILRRAIRYTICRKRMVNMTQKNRELSLLRLFENETYRWVIIRYLKMNNNHE